MRWCLRRGERTNTSEYVWYVPERLEHDVSKDTKDLYNQLTLLWLEGGARSTNRSRRESDRSYKAVRQANYRPDDTKCVHLAYRNPSPVSGRNGQNL